MSLALCSQLPPPLHGDLSQPIICFLLIGFLFWCYNFDFASVPFVLISLVMLAFLSSLSSLYFIYFILVAVCYIISLLKVYSGVIKESNAFPC